MDTTPIITRKLGGIDRRWSVGAEGAVRVEDMRWDKQRAAWTSGVGFRRIIIGPLLGQPPVITNPFAGLPKVNSVHFFSQHNGARSWIIYEAGANLYLFNPSTAARTASPGDIARDRANNQQNDRANPSTPWQRSQSATWGDNFYLVNGINRPLVFDGYTWDYAGFAGPAGQPSVVVMDAPVATTMQSAKLRSVGLGPTSELGGGTPTDYRCGYRWRVSLINSRGEESPLSEPSSLVTFTNTGGTGTTNGAHFCIVSLPIGGGEVVARRLYRTQNVMDATGNPVQGYADTFYFHSDIPDNVTAFLMDGLLDSNLGLPVDPLDYGPWPVNGKYLCSFKSTMFLAGDTATEVYFSAPNHPEIFPVDNVIPLADADMGPITGFYPTRNSLVVFKHSGIWLVKGNPAVGFTADILTRTTGCAAPNTVKEVPGLGLVFLGADDVYVMIGALEGEGTPTRVIPLGAPVQAYIKRISRSALISACAAVNHRDEEYWLAITQLGDDENDMALKLHYAMAPPQWSTVPSVPISCILETSDHRSEVIFGSNDTTLPGLYVLSEAFTDKGGVAIAPLYQTGWFDAGGVWRSIRPHHVQVHVGLHGNNDLRCTVTSNRSTTTWDALASQDQQDVQDATRVLGSLSVGTVATFDTTGVLWNEVRPGTLRWDISDPKKAFVHECSVTLQPESGLRWMTLQAVDLELDILDPSGNKPLSPTVRGGR